MTKARLLGFVVLLGSATISAAKRPAEVAVSLASAAGAALDSNLVTGGGTDDTAVLQGVLDRAATGRPAHLIIDGPALVRGLDVYGNSTIECIAGAGLYLKDGSNRAIIRNAHRSSDAIQDEHITLRGCFLNGNRQHQSGVTSSSTEEMCPHQEADRTWMSGLEFFGVNDLTIENVTVWAPRSYGAQFANANRIDIRNVTVDHGASSDDVHMQDGCTDGLHFTGGVKFVTIDSVKFRTGDDGLSFCADATSAPNDEGPYVKQGPITDVSVTNVEVMNATSALRFVSSKLRIDRVVVSNVTGTITSFFVVGISHYLPAGVGNFGSITLDSVNVNRADPLAPTSLEVSEYVRQHNDRALNAEFNSGVLPIFNINAHVESLILRNIVTRAFNDRPVLRIGPDSDVRMMSVDLNIDDPTLQSIPLQLDEGARVERLNLSLNWKGNSVDQSKNPIQNRGGSIGQLNWVNTPPMYVAAELSNANTVVVTFSQDVKAIDFKAGVSIKTNGRPVGISSARREHGRSDVVRFRLQHPARVQDVVTWAYDASTGDIHNVGGNQLLSVSEKTVASR